MCHAAAQARVREPGAAPSSIEGLPGLRCGQAFGRAAVAGDDPEETADETEETADGDETAYADATEAEDAEEADEQEDADYDEMTSMTGRSTPSTTPTDPSQRPVTG